MTLPRIAVTGWSLALILAGAVRGQQLDSLLVAVSQTDNALAIFRVNGNTLSPIAKAPIGNGAREVCLAANGKRAYVTNAKDNTITVVDLDSAQSIDTMALPGLKAPDGCATSPDSKKLYVANMDANEVVIVSTATNKILKRVNVGKEPRRVLFSPDARRIYVSSEVSDEIMILNAATDTVVDRLKAGGHGPRTMLFMPDNKTMLTTNVDDDTISFIKLATKQAYLTIGAGGSPQRLALSSDGLTAYVLAVLESKISMVDLKDPHIRARKFVPVGAGPWGMAMSKDHRLLFVGSTKENSIAAYDTANMTVVAKASVNRPMGIEVR